MSARAPSGTDAVWTRLVAELEALPREIRDVSVTPGTSPAALRAILAERFPLEQPMALPALTGDVAALLRRHSLHVTHPRYFGLFNPSVREAGIVGDTLAALYNLQLAAWSHSPAANEIERHVLRFFARALGYDADASLGNFTSGGAEANTTAVLAALAHAHPETATRGVAALDRPPVLYVTGESHHSFVKAARMTGLGTDALREVPVTARLGMDVDALRAALRDDAAAGRRPLLIVGTAGTTAAGVIDPLPAIADAAREAGAWFHVDAAWGGAAALSPRLRPVLAGIERSDSVTWDAHKWLQVPMGAGMFFTRHPEAVARAFAVNASYMPGAVGAEALDPYAVTAQWSRRATGLKVFMTVAELGARGLAAMIDAMTDMGDLLRARLVDAGWTIVNDTPLPLVTFTHPDIRAGRLTTGALLDALHARGRAWISEVFPGGRERVLRACVTSWRTEAGDVDVLLDELELAREAATRSS